MLSIICALDQNNAIGYKGKLLYHIPNDLKRFKKLTTGHTVIMGRNTFESLPGKEPLKNRRNIVLSKTLQNNIITDSGKEVEVFPNLQMAIDACNVDDEIFIIGGESLYKIALPIVDRMYLTYIHTNTETADTFFPEIKDKDWHQWQSWYVQTYAATNDLPSYTFVNYQKR
jgi:dihydrofolate reductase